MTVVSTSPLDQIADAPAKPSRRLRLKGVPWIPLTILTLVIIAAIGGDLIAPHDPGALNLGLAFRPPFCKSRKVRARSGFLKRLPSAGAMPPGQ